MHRGLRGRSRGRRSRRGGTWWVVLGRVEWVRLGLREEDCGLGCGGCYMHRQLWF